MPKAKQICEKHYGKVLSILDNLGGVKCGKVVSTNGDKVGVSLGFGHVLYTEYAEISSICDLYNEVWDFDEEEESEA